MPRFVDGALDVKKAVEAIEDPSICASAFNEVSSIGTKETSSVTKKEKNMGDHITDSLSEQVDNVIWTCRESGQFPCSVQLPKASVKKVS